MNIYSVFNRDEKGSSGYTLSGDLTAQFTTSSPGNTATVKLRASDAADCDGTALYSTTTTAWGESVGSKGTTTYTRYASYSISGIEGGTYMVCGSIETGSLYDYDPYGPVSVTIPDSSTRDITF